MSVRWKPLIVLSALFVLIAAVGLLAITATFLPGGADAKLREARAAVEAGRFDNAEIHYRNALQVDPRNAEIHQEFAEMLGAWIAADPSRAPKSGPVQVAEWIEAAKYGPRLVAPRKALLRRAIDLGNDGDAIAHAEELRTLEPDDTDALAVLAADALDRRPPEVAEAAKLVDALARSEPEHARTRSLRARVAEAKGDDAELDRLLDEFRPTAPDGPAEERLARAQLRALDLRRAKTPAEVASRGEALRAEVEALAVDSSAPGIARRLTGLVRSAQDRLAEADADPATKALDEGPRGGRHPDL